MRLLVIGLGKVGLPLAAVLASRGHDVVGLDLNPDVVAAVRAGQSPYDETGLQALMSRLPTPIDAVTTADAILSDIYASFIIVPTPSAADGRFSNDAVIAAMQTLGKVLRRQSSYHLATLVSTVMPCSMDDVIRPAIESSSGRSIGDNLGLCYSPEFIALGSVIADLERPDLALIGESDARAGDALEQLKRQICRHESPIRRMNFVNAEVTKLAVNGFVTTRISYANMLSEICERLPGADATTVTEAIACDSRIGKGYLTPALGYGGPCFPRDNAAFAKLAEDVGTTANLAIATANINLRQADRICEIVARHLNRGTVAILGLAYKPLTSVCDESQGILIANALVQKGYQVAVSDPAAKTADLAQLDQAVLRYEDMNVCAQSSDLLIIATAWPDFLELVPASLHRQGAKLPVIDCWRLLANSPLSAHIRRIEIGKGS